MVDIRLLILGTGGMANNHADAFAAVPGVNLVAGIDTSSERLAAFQTRHNVAHGFASLDDALSWGEFDAVCNVTPDAAHFATTMPLLAAGKHILCEKPLATSAADADAMAAAAKAAGVVNMVNLSYRVSPALCHAADLAAQGALGEIRHLEASYLQSWLLQPAWGEWSTDPTWLWRMSTAHGSAGTLGDVGVHILDFATFAAGLPVTEVSCKLAVFDKAPGGKIDDYVLDANDSFTMQLRLANGALGVVHATRMAPGHHNDLYLKLFGTKGGVEISYENDTSRLRTCIGADALLSGTWQEIDCPPVPSNYERFIAAINGTDPGLPDFARGATLQHVLDRAVQSDAQGAVFLEV